MSIMEKLGEAWAEICAIRAGGAELYVDERGLVRGRARDGALLDAQTVRRGKRLQQQYNREAVWLMRAEAEGRLFEAENVEPDALGLVGEAVKRGEAQLVGRVKMDRATGLCSCVWVLRPEAASDA